MNTQDKVNLLLILLEGAKDAYGRDLPAAAGYRVGIDAAINKISHVFPSEYENYYEHEHSNKPTQTEA